MDVVGELNWQEKRRDPHLFALDWILILDYFAVFSCAHSSSRFPPLVSSQSFAVLSVCGPAGAQKMYTLPAWPAAVVLESPSLASHADKSMDGIFGAYDLVDALCVAKDIST